MPHESRDSSTVEHILRYCRQIETAHRDFGRSKESFFESTTYQNAICMCILQIGELVGHLSEAFREKHQEIPWKKIRGMRNFVAHEYGHLDLEVVWYVATVSIRDVEAFCGSYLSQPSDLTEQEAEEQIINGFLK